LNICTFASGSRGNCALVWHKNTYILIDAGISMRRIVNNLKKLGLEAGQITSILITHEHTDHISGLPMLMKHFKIPMFASGGTARSIARRGVLPDGYISVFETGRTFGVGDMEICSFETPHDTAESVGFTLSAGGRKLAFTTDLGHVSPKVEQAVMGCDTVVLESNHDIEMLKAGSYPYMTKVRILGKRGHLSNDAGGEFASRLVEGGTKKIMLAHLSRDNNTSELAFSTVSGKLLEAGIKTGSDMELHIAPANEMSPLLDI
jgi:phosphoribosyl 1,2-cyclic phosphodiesterase